MNKNFNLRKFTTQETKNNFNLTINPSLATNPPLFIQLPLSNFQTNLGSANKPPQKIRLPDPSLKKIP